MRSLFLLLAAAIPSVNASAQVPNPSRTPHPGIAPPSAALLPTLAGKAAPLFAVPDGKWNHGEGFVAGPGGDADRGGWHGPDDGSGLMAVDIHHLPQPNGTGPNWVPFSWEDPVGLHPAGQPPGAPMLRLEGFLRPVDAAGNMPPLETQHPLFGTANIGSYVDQGAFELFKPTTPRPTSAKIVVAVMTWQTTQFPEDFAVVRQDWRQIYMGFFSRDGLIRPEVFTTVRTTARKCSARRSSV
ncbi:MAG: hypothetical protein MUC36_28115 [Planctomycetes bacterium]|nr:hypothetical protein [Planctomycetota bacterium]